MNTTEIQAFVRAILDDPDDDLVRLVFADWLQERGQEARAAWIRSSLELAKLPRNHSDRPAMVKSVDQQFRRCRPKWWRPIAGVEIVNDRGLIRLAVKSTGIVRLGQTDWLDLALKQGWLRGIEVKWAKSPLAELFAGLDSPAKNVPIYVELAPYEPSPRLDLWLSLPQLCSLDIPTSEAMSFAAEKSDPLLLLGEHPGLRELRVVLPFYRDRVILLISQLARCTTIHRLTLVGDRQGLCDADFMPLVEMANLLQLTYDAWGSITDEGLEEIQKLRPSLIIKRVCP